jgi:hypothetical protein
VDTSWKPADIGYFDPGLPDTSDGSYLLNNITYYTNVEVFLDRIRDISSLKPPEIVSTKLHSCLKGAALCWYTHELPRDAQRLLGLQPLEEGWFKSLATQFKPSRTESLQLLETTKYTREKVQAGQTPQQYAQKMFRLLRSTGTSNFHDQILKILSNIEPSLARDIGGISGDFSADSFMAMLNYHYRSWKRQADERRYQDAGGQSVLNWPTQFIQIDVRGS